MLYVGFFRHYLFYQANLNVMNAFVKKKSLKIKNNIFEITEPMVMGVLNLTPDSFFDGGQYQNIDEILKKVRLMISEGVDIIDIGGASTRPGATEITEEEEIMRVIEPIEEISKAFPEAIISIDTYRAKVAAKAIMAGADIINDISAGDDDEKMIDTVADLKVPYIIMHKQGKPQNMQANPVYENVVKDILKYFSEKLNQLKLKGISDIIIDPGFGFGKTLEHNYQLLKHLKEFEFFELPILIGVSRKSMINKVLKTKPEDALNGTSVLHTIALQNGADILRVHDVKEAKEVIKLITLYNQTK
jgi:dihydropteroate synthase